MIIFTHKKHNNNLGKSQRLWHVTTFVASRSCWWVHRTNSHKKKRFIQIIMNLKTLAHFVFFLKETSQGWGFEGNDYHIMLQKILPLHMQHFMTKGCRMAIICLCHVFERLRANIMEATTMGEFKNDMAITLILLEKEFSPSFFVVMTHLLVHLAKEL